MDKEILELAIKLYLDLPFWKRWRVFRYYQSNNWDVTDNWTQCVKVASKMIDDAKFILNKETK